MNKALSLLLLLIAGIPGFRASAREQENEKDTVKVGTLKCQWPKRSPNPL